MQPDTLVDYGSRIFIRLRSERVKKSSAQPIGLYWAVTGWVKLDDSFTEVIRIDNAAHRGGTHIHVGSKIVFVKHMLDPMDAWHRVEQYLLNKYQYLLGDEDG